MDTLFNRDEWIKENGISVNSDGSTNNHTDYYAWCRDFWIGTLFLQFFIYIGWAILISSMMYYLSFYSLCGPFNESGMILDFLNTGVIPFYVNIVAHHVMCLAETRNHTWFSTGWYILSICLFLLTIWFNDVFEPSMYFGMQFSVIIKSPVTWFHVIIQSAIIYLPRYIYKVLQHVVFHPEFTKIKGA